MEMYTTELYHCYKMREYYKNTYSGQGWYPSLISNLEDRIMQIEIMLNDNGLKGID